MTIKPALIAVLEAALNRYLAMDGDAGYFLAPLAGKVIAVTIQPFSETLYLCPGRSGIQILDYYPGLPDTQLTGSLMALTSMGLSVKPERSLFSGDVTIQGDTLIGRQFQEVFARLDIDWEEQLSHVTGDVIAHQIGRFFRAGQAWGRDSLDTLQQNLSEFLQEETRDLPAQPEADRFYREVDELRSDSDRLLKRLERLEKSGINSA